MKKTKFLIASICFILSSLFTTYAQWTSLGTNIWNTNLDYNIGIGTNNPNTKLDVNGGLTVGSSSVNWNTTKLFLRNPAGKTWALSSGTNMINENSFSIYNWTSNPNAPFFHISELGSVGIGTSSPKSLLDVNGEISINGRIGMYLNEPSATFLYNTYTMGHYSLGWFNDPWCSSYGPALWGSGWGGIKLFTNGSPRFVIDNMGRIGIGTVNPQNQLDVNGTIHAKQVLVDLNNWADFVFNNEYVLPKLSDVNNYIQINGHLPNIPSETEVKAKGINVAEMQVKLLQKIEELTLYIIEQDKKIKELETKIK